MILWEERPVELAHLLNPAFCSVLLWDAISGYRKERGQGLPFPLAFLVLPIVLHKPTRQALPRSVTTRLHVWLQDKPEVRIQFAERTRQLAPYVREAIMFGSQNGILAITDSGELTQRSRRLPSLDWNSETEPSTCRSKAIFVGRWFAQAGGVSTIFTMWGIQP